MMDVSKIALLSTVINFDLYAKSASYFPKEIPKYIIDGRNGMHGIHSILYMMKKLENNDIDWLILADEDVLFTDSNSVFEIIQKMQDEDYIFCGIRDGGVISHRNYNPLVPNTFFSVVNFKDIKKIWNQKEMLSNQYLLENEFIWDGDQLPFKFDAKSLYEPYYCFYLWLLRKGKKALFLAAEMPFADDAISNSVLNLDGNPMLFHTWYARSYGKNKKHTERIDNVFNKIKVEGHASESVVVFKDKTFKFKSWIRKYLKKIKNKIQ